MRDIEDLATEFELHRPRLRAVAYRRPLPSSDPASLEDSGLADWRVQRAGSGLSRVSQPPGWVKCRVPLGSPVTIQPRMWMK